MALMTELNPLREARETLLDIPVSKHHHADPTKVSGVTKRQSKVFCGSNLETQTAPNTPQTAKVLPDIANPDQ